MKLFKLFFYFLIILSTIFVFNITKSNKINYVAIGDSISKSENSYGEIIYGYVDYIYDYYNKRNKLNSYYNFSNVNCTIQNLIDDIDNNKTIFLNGKKINYKKSLRESDLVTISVGILDISDQVSKNINNSNLSVEFINEIQKKLNELIILVKKYSKNEIIILGYYNPFPNIHDRKEVIDNYIITINNKLKEISKKNGIKYIDIFNEFNNNNYLDNPFSINPNSLGYKKIYLKILNEL